MANLAQSMPPLEIPGEELKKWGALWSGTLNPETGILYPHYVSRYKGLPPHD